MKFSVAMCTYNGAAYLNEQLDSIARQTRLPDELVVCDDRSSDGSLGIIRAFSARSLFPVHLRLNDDNLGSTKNFEKAINLCEGDIIALSDQDDVWHPEKLALLERKFSSAPDVGLVFTDANVVNEHLNAVGPRLWQLTLKPKEQRLFEVGRHLDVLLQRNVLTGATMAFRAKFRNLIAPIPANLLSNLVHDWWIALVVASVADVSSIRKPLIEYRQHSRQQWGVLKDMLSIERGHQKLAPSLQEQADFYVATKNLFTELRNRLLQVRGDYDVGEKIELIGARMDFLERQAAHMRSRSRARAMKKRVSRMPFILTELAALRYRRYSNGLRSAVRDFLQ